MLEQRESKAFRESFNVILKNQEILAEIHNETIGLINDITKRSKKYMLQISDIEDGLFDDEQTNKQTISQNLKRLIQDIEQFNHKINVAREKFNQAIADLIQAFTQAIQIVKKGEGNKKELKHARWYIKYLDVLLRKFKFKVNRLQLMNNILFAFSKEMQTVQDAYKKNLKVANSETSSALEQCKIILKEIEEI